MPRLKHVGRDDLTIQRQRRGRGYVYLGETGRPVRDEEVLARARHLAIPPAWRDVRIADSPVAHIQACGVDDAGRVQQPPVRPAAVHRVECDRCETRALVGLPLVDQPIVVGVFGFARLGSATSTTVVEDLLDGLMTRAGLTLTRAERRDRR